MLTRRSKWFLALSAATPLLFAACTDNNIFNPQGNAVGTYQLTVYAGHTMPATFVIQPGDPDFPEAPNGGTFVVTGGQLVLNSNGSFSEVNNFSITPSGGSSQPSSFQSTGTWTLNGTSFTLSDTFNNRFVSGTLAEDVSGNIKVNYQETDASGTVQSFEYAR